ncbi:MAG: MBL fold metallo-hydrolase [Candidatus Aenigmarchaeota archaeon]|nr:MBL fold metallo-hydrolase [Candidatus Aenigmarchaeota archaeon]
MGLELVLTGTGGAQEMTLNYKRRLSDALLKYNDDKGEVQEIVKLDYNGQSAMGLVEEQIAPSAYKTIILSHGHSDHSLGLSMRLKAMLGECESNLDLKDSTEKRTLYTTKETREMLAEVLEFSEHGRNDGGYNYRTGNHGEYIYKNSKNGIETLKIVATEDGMKTDISDNLQITFFEVTHPHGSSFSKIRGDSANGYLITDKNKKEKTGNTLLYLSDYKDINDKDKQRIGDHLKGNHIDAVVLGQPVPFSDEENKKGHMGLEESIEFCEYLKDKNLADDSLTVVITHMSDRWTAHEEEYIKKTKEIMKKHNFNLYLPKEDGLRINVEDKRVKIKGECYSINKHKLI